MTTELIYFDVQGRAAAIRIMLKLAGIDYKDTRIPCESWEEEKHRFENMALGQLPILKVGDEIYCQEQAIEEYCAIKAGLIPESPEDAMRVKMIIGNYFLNIQQLKKSFRNDERGSIFPQGSSSIYYGLWKLGKWELLRSW